MSQKDVNTLLALEPLPDRLIEDVRQFNELASLPGTHPLFKMAADQLLPLADEVVRLREDIHSATLPPDAIGAAAKIFSTIYEEADLAGDETMAEVGRRGHRLCMEIFRLHLVAETDEHGNPKTDLN